MRIGVWGAGHLGKIHIRLLKEITDFKLVGFYDPDEKAGRAVEEEFGIQWYSSSEELMSLVQAMDIVAPTPFHYELAKAGIKSAKHLFIEKPVTETVEQARELMNLSKEANVTVQIGHVERFNPAFAAAREYFNQPMFIEAHRLAEFNPRGTDVSVVLDLMIHDIDIILSVVKSSVKKINASAVAVVSDTPDICNARIEFDNGCVANLTSSRISLKNMRKHRFFQRDAYISVDFLKKKTEIVKLKAVEGDTDPLAMLIDLGKGKGKKQIFFETPEIGEVNAIKTELSEFYKAILTQQEPPVSLYDGFQALNVAQQIIERTKHLSVLHD